MNIVPVRIQMVLALLIANGVFAMSGLALVSSGKSPFEQRAKTGGAGAAAALIAPPWTES